MDNQRTQESTPASLPEGCCKFSKTESKKIRDDISRQDFTWIPVYEAIAPKLLDYRNNRRELVEGLYKQASLHEHTMLRQNLSNYEEQLADKTTLPMSDICPFSVLATFTLETQDKKKMPVAEAVCEFLDVDGKPAIKFSRCSNLVAKIPPFLRAQQK